MSDLTVPGQVASGSGTTTASATLTGVTDGNTLVAFFGDGSSSTPTLLSVADGQGSYAPRGSRVTDPGDAVVIQSFTLSNANAGSHTIIGTTDSGNACDIVVVEIGSTAGASSFSGANQAFQNAPGSATDALSSGTVTITGASTLLCFALDSGSTLTVDEPVAGTGFTSRSAAMTTALGVFRLATIAASADRAATATVASGAGAQQYLTLGVAILNAGAAAQVLEDVLHRPALMAILAQ